MQYSNLKRKKALGRVQPPWAHLGGLQRIMLRAIIITPAKTSNPPILIGYLKNGLLLLTTPIALNIRIKPITISMKPTTGKNPVIIGIQNMNS
jgi:hypothetical protein